jgi:heterodisulfide reductase subunit D
MKLSQLFEQEKQRILDNCTACGICFKKCPISCKTALADRKPAEVQQALKDFLAQGVYSEELRERVASCMKCYGCVRDMCPQGLNPMRTLEICDWEMSRAGLIEHPPWDPKHPELVHRVLASIQISSRDYQRIMTSSPQGPADTVFFAGCNVYYQPEKLLNALDVMALIDERHAFVPGLDFCCGNCHLTKGRPDRAGAAFGELMQKLEAYEPKTVVLWCPTCFCVAETTFGPFTGFPFEIMTMAQYVTANLDKLDIKHELGAKVTVHDACKVALTGLDVEGCREILRTLGANIAEMPRSGAKAVCCGSAAMDNHPGAGFAMLEDRIAEAGRSGAEIMATVCHYCNQLLASRQEGTGFVVESYINLLAAGLGIKREDKFRKYMSWADKERILADAAPFITQSPFSQELIESTVQEVFGC